VILRRADDVLRGRSASYPWSFLVLCGVFYGAVMGTYGVRGWQIAYSALKVPLLLLATLALSLPSYFVANTLMGLRADFAATVRALVAAQAALTIVLASLAPMTMLWYASSTDYPAAILFNAIMFAVASFASQVVLVRAYRPLVARSEKHRWLLRTWIFIYAFVGIQMGWSLRPFIGDPDAPVRFFREEWGDNAYVFVARLIWRTLVP
jgi:hypothetical protein